MPLSSTLAYYKELLDQLPMPGGAPPLNAYITPPNPDTAPDGAPRAYIWTNNFDESRSPEKGGTVPRALYKGASSGTKPLDHSVHIYVVWDQQADDPQADSWFPGMIDAIMWQLRVSTDPVPITDTFDGTSSQLIDVGEEINGQITVRALDTERYLRYDCLLTCPTLELIRS